MGKKRKIGLAPLLVLTVVGLCAIGGITFAVSRIVAPNVDKTNTEDPQKLGDDAKQAIVDEQNKVPDGGGDDVGVANITVVDATYYTLQPGAQADAVEVRAFVSNAGTSGTCKVTASSKQGTSLVREVSAESDGRNVWCQTVTIPIDRQQFDSESPWKAKIEFTSPDATGSTEADIKVM